MSRLLVPPRACRGLHLSRRNGRKCDVPAATGGGTLDPLETRWSSRGGDAAALRQNAAMVVRERRLMAGPNLPITAIDCINLIFHWDFPKPNICWERVRQLPQYVVGFREGRCINQGRSAAITVGYRAQVSALSPQSVAKNLWWRVSGVGAWLPENASRARQTRAGTRKSEVALQPACVTTMC